MADNAAVFSDSSSSEDEDDDFMSQVIAQPTGTTSAPVTAPASTDGAQADAPAAASRATVVDSESSDGSDDSDGSSDDSDSDDDDTQARTSQRQDAGAAAANGSSSRQRRSKASTSRKSKKRKPPTSKDDAEESVKLELFIKKMRNAAQRDKIAKNQKLPPIAKIKMLPALEAHMTIPYTRAKLLESDVLKVFDTWLHVDKDDLELPSRTIRTALINILSHIPVEGENLVAGGDSESGNFVESTDSPSYITIDCLKENRNLGVKLNFLKQHPHETQKNKQKVAIILERWVRLYHRDEQIDRRAARTRSRLRSPARKRKRTTAS